MVKYVTFNHCNMSSNLIALKKKIVSFIIILMQKYIGLTRNSTKVEKKILHWFSIFYVKAILVCLY